MKKLLTILLATTALTAHAENVSGEVSLTPVKPYVFGTVGTAQVTGPNLVSFIFHGSKTCSCKI